MTVTRTVDALALTPALSPHRGEGGVDLQGKATLSGLAGEGRGEGTLRVLALAVLLAGSAVACGSGVRPGGFSEDGGSSGSTDATTHDAPILDFDSSHGTLTSLSIAPATTTLTVTNPAKPPTVQLKAIARYKDGSTAPISASWTVTRPDIATIGAGTGRVTPTGATFGTVGVTAKASGKTATATVTVDLKETLDPGMLPASAKSALNGAKSPDPSVTTFAYPYDETYFPRGLLPPEQQWNGGAAGDAYSIHLTGPSFDLTVYLKADPPSRYTLPVASWNALTTTLPGADVTVELRRLTGKTAYVSATQKWHVADANLGGTIYYWSISEGQIYAIDLATGTRSAVFASGDNTALGTPVPLNSGAPTTPPWESNGTATANTRCVACHSVSKDGSTLSSVFARGAPGSTGPLGFVNIAAKAITGIGDYQDNGIYDALVPDGSQAVLNFDVKTMQLIDKASGAPLPSALDGQSNLCDPAFSPDGTKCALAANCDPGFGYPVEFRTSNLVVYSYANTAPYFTAPQTLVTSTGIGDAIAFPSFSPDSKFVFFQRGDYSRAKYGAGPPYSHGNDDLYVVSTTPGATPVALANANDPAGVLPLDSQHLNYAPTVNPISAGGYIWVVFTTPRDYGNEIVSPEGAAPMDATYSNRKQLWVSAVDATIGKADPSHPAFWLPGQDMTTPNMFGYWALSPCKPTLGDGGPETCSAGFECCSGFCRDTGKGPVCVNNPGGCHETGEKCSVTSDCCDASSGVSCVGGICQETKPR
jgi:hypothetical protein